MTECAICTNEYTEEDDITPLPCNVSHYFHTSCIETWLKQKTECPLCRSPVDPQQLSEFTKHVDDLLEQ